LGKKLSGGKQKKGEEEKKVRERGREPLLKKNGSCRLSGKNLQQTKIRRGKGRKALEFYREGGPPAADRTRKKEGEVQEGGGEGVVKRTHRMLMKKGPATRGKSQRGDRCDGGMGKKNREGRGRVLGAW